MQFVCKQRPLTSAVHYRVIQSFSTIVEMECTVCCRTDSKLTPIEAHLIKPQRLCVQCISDLFTKDFDQDLSSDSDDSSQNLATDYRNDLDGDDSNSLINESGQTDIVGHTVDEKETTLKDTCSLCGERLANRRSLAKHMKKFHPEDKINRCHICRRFFKGAKQFESHIQNEHAGFSNICSVCLEGYGKGEKLIHEKACVGRLLFECSECRKQFVSSEGLTKHLDIHQISEETQNSFCVERRSHQKIQICVLCDDDQGYEENAYWNHIHERHDGRHLRCTDCGKTFRNRKHLVVHKGIQCKVGIRARERATKLQEPVQSQCQFCFKMFRNRTLLQNHVAKIHKAQPVVCDLCGLSLANRNQMRYHRIKSHSDPTEKCPHCPKQFHLASDLRQHLTTHEEVGKFICEECGRVFKRKVGLELHIKSHLKDTEKPNRRLIPGSTGKHACELCDRRFKHNYVLLAHKKTHDGNRVLEKKYNCEECDRKFATSAGLFYHMRGKYVHQKITCSICSAVIKGRERYEEHLAVHTGH